MKTVDLVEQVLSSYGDLLYDFCESILGQGADLGMVHAQSSSYALRSILKTIRSSSPDEIYRKHERAWVLRIACQKLRQVAGSQGRSLTPDEQLELDSSPEPSVRLERFERFFHRLPTEDRLLLTLRDKYRLPYPEVSAALGVPEGSLKLQRQHALRTLEEWLWNSSG